MGSAAGFVCTSLAAVTLLGKCLFGHSLTAKISSIHQGPFLHPGESQAAPKRSLFSREMFHFRPLRLRSCLQGNPSSRAETARLSL